MSGVDLSLFKGGLDSQKVGGPRYITSFTTIATSSSFLESPHGLMRPKKNYYLKCKYKINQIVNAVFLALTISLLGC